MIMFWGIKGVDKVTLNDKLLFENRGSLEVLFILRHEVNAHLNYVHFYGMIGFRQNED